MTAQTSEKSVFIGKTVILTDFDWVYRLAWSPNSKYFAVIGIKGSGDSQTSSVAVYEASTQRVVKSLPIKKSGTSFGDVAFSPDGKYLAGGTGIVTLWDTKTWQSARDIRGPFDRGLYASSGVNSIAFSPDSKSLAVFYDSVVYPETVKVNTIKDQFALGDKLRAALNDQATYWEKLAKDEIVRYLQVISTFNVETTQTIFSARMFDSTPERGGHLTGNLTYTPDGQYLLSSRVEHHKLKHGEYERYFTFLEFRDPKTGQIVKEMSGLHVMQINAIAVSPDGKFIATGTQTTADRLSSK